MKQKLVIIFVMLTMIHCLFAIKNYSKIFPVVDDSGLLEIYLGYNEYETFTGYRDAKLDKLEILFEEQAAYINEIINCYSIPGYFYNHNDFSSYGTRSFVHDLNDNLLLLLKRYYDQPESYYDFIYRASDTNITEFSESYIFFPEEFVTSPRNYIHNIIKDCEGIIYVSYKHDYWGPASGNFIYQTDDNGKTWSKMLNINHQSITNMILKDVHPDDNNIMFFAKDNGYLYRSEDRGLTTTLVDSTNAMDWFEYIALNGSNDFIFCGNGLIYANCFSVAANCWKIMKSIDDGFNWTVLSDYSGYGLNCLDVDSQNPGVLYACDNYQIRKSVNYGVSFTTLVDDYQTNAPIKGLYQIDGTDTIIFLNVLGPHVYYSPDQIYPLGYAVPNSDYDIPGVYSSIKASSYPNPFNPETTIKYKLPIDGKTSIQIFNIKGQLVKTLINEYLTSGEHSIIWSGTSNNESKCPSGVYFYRIMQNNDFLTKKIVLAK
ncbi:T9SS type A sorting domain-containing protein [bacterium]|nr:T9SS type A sorting domain-containing protein [bacterium]